jgi:hypothetical protein
MIVDWVRAYEVVPGTGPLPTVTPVRPAAQM